MARAYSDDLRKKLLKACLAGQGTLRELAARFDVSVAWAWKVSSAHKKTGSMERAPQVRHGRLSRVDGEQVKRLLDAQPDFTLHGLGDALAAAGTTVSPAHLWRVLRKLGYRLKKSRSTPPHATPKPPYSPDLNPIEKARSKLKQALRAAKARTTSTRYCKSTRHHHPARRSCMVQNTVLCSIADR